MPDTFFPNLDVKLNGLGPFNSMLFLIFPQHIIYKVQYDWSRRQTVLEDLMQLGACVRLVLRRM